MIKIHVAEFECSMTPAQEESLRSSMQICGAAAEISDLLTHVPPSDPDGLRHYWSMEPPDALGYITFWVGNGRAFKVRPDGTIFRASIADYV